MENKKLYLLNELDFLNACGILDSEDVLKKIEVMNNNAILKQHPYAITEGTNGRWYTYLPDSTKPHGRKQIAKSTRKKIEEAIIADYKKKIEIANLNLLSIEKLFELWMIWRRDTGTDPKTIKENKNDWNCFLRENSFAQKKVVTVEMFDIETFFLEITINHAITYKRLINVKSLLNGIFKHAIRLKLIQNNPMRDVDFKQFQTRCKPTSSDKCNYTLEERKKILDYLCCNDEEYSLAVQLAFYLCVRIGKLLSIKKTDIQNDKIYISRSIRKHQTMNDDLSFSGVEYTIEERIKGNQTEGFRYIPLTAQAKKIVDKTIHLYPEGEYLFMRNGKPLFADSFNRYLKNKVCAPLNIPYRSSHQIRFTVATMLYEAGVPLNQLSTMLGHSDTRTTFHYIRQQTSKKETYDIMKNVLDVNR